MPRRPFALRRATKPHPAPPNSAPSPAPFPAAARAPLPDRPPARPALGLVLAASAVFLFALTDVLGKDLMTRHPVEVVQAGRYLVNLALMVLVFAPSMGARLWRAEARAVLLLRGLILAGSSLAMGYALRVMPVAETVAIIYLAPFAVMLLSGPVLREKVGLASWIGAGIAFAGVLMILRPGAGLDPVGVALSLLNALLSTAYHLMTRALTRRESVPSMLFHVALAGSVVFVLLALPHLRGLSLSPRDLAEIAGLGLVSTGGHLLFTLSYRVAPPALLAPISYLHLVWAALLGWMAFGHMPDLITAAGIALVVLAGTGTALRGARG